MWMCTCCNGAIASSRKITSFFSSVIAIVSQSSIKKQVLHFGIMKKVSAPILKQLGGGGGGRGGVPYNKQ